MKASISSLLAIASLTAATQFVSAATDPKYVEKIDSQREGNLQLLVKNHVLANAKHDCGGHDVYKIDAIKTWANVEKRPGTPYEYEATYLVIQKCHTGSTFVGAYITTEKASLVSASFRSNYNSKGGPEKMENLNIKIEKDVEVTVKK